MRAGRLVVVVLAAAGVWTAAAAQVHVGENIAGGLPWHVAALQGARWSLECRFKPVKFQDTAYNSNAWANRLSRQARGSQGGRLPSNDGSCTVTKTGGRGAVAVAMIKNGEARVAVTTDPARPAAVGFF
jgi:hypothetical protein